MQIALKTDKGDNGHNSLEGDNHIKAHCGGSDKNLKRGNGGHITPIKADDKILYRDGSNTLNRNKGLHSTPIQEHRYIVHTT